MTTAKVNEIEEIDEALSCDELPDGWEAVTLPEICDINPPKPSVAALPSDALVTFVPMPAVDAYRGAITHPQTRPFSKVRKVIRPFRTGT